MQIFIQARGFDLSAGLREHVERRLHFALDWAYSPRAAGLSSSFPISMDRVVARTSAVASGLLHPARWTW